MKLELREILVFIESWGQVLGEMRVKGLIVGEIRVEEQFLWVK